MHQSSTRYPSRARAQSWLAAVLVVTALLLVGAATAAKAAGDDYPWRGQGVCQNTGQATGYCSTSTWVVGGREFDSWGFGYRNCTSWVAWRLRNTNGVDFFNGMRGGRWGNANTWDDNARALGYRVDGTPAVGAIAQTDAGGWGHVAWVRSVNSDGTVTIEEYNRHLDGAFGVRTVARSSFVYLHVKDLPGAAAAPYGSVDHVQSAEAGRVHVAGWAIDNDARTSPVTIHAYVGGQAGTAGAEGHDLGPAGVARPDVGAAFPGAGDRHGFDAAFSTARTGVQQVCVYAINIGPGDNPLLGCRSVTISNPQPFGSFDEATGGAATVRVRGWTIDRSSPATPTRVHVYVGGRAGEAGAEGHDIGEAGADRPDVAAVHPWAGPRHGFDTRVTTAKRGAQTVCAYAINVGVGDNQGLGCRTVVIAEEAAPTITLSSTVIPAGQTVTVTYRGTPGTTLTILSRTHPASTFTRIGTVPLDAAGTGRSVHSPRRTTRLYATTATGIGSAQPLVQVRSLATLAARRVAPRTYTFSGTVGPPLNGRLVSLYRNGVVVAQGRTSASGAYAITRTFAGGTYSFAVRTPDDSYNLGATSRTLRATIS